MAEAQGAEAGGPGDGRSRPRGALLAQVTVPALGALSHAGVQRLPSFKPLILALLGLRGL